MTESPRPTTPSAVQLMDIDRHHVWLDWWLGAVNRGVLILLALATLAFSLLTISSSAMANAVTPHNGPVYVEQRMSFVLAALITGVAFGMLSRRLNNTWAWAHLPINGSLRATRKGLRLRHDGVLDGEVLIDWRNIKVIALDSGRNHDNALNWRRFPIPSPSYDRQYLFDTDSGEIREDFALIAGRPTAPNIAIVLNKPIALRNPNSQLTEISFPNKTKGSLPAQPPAGHTAASGLFLRTRNLKRTRQLLLPSGKLRALRSDDLG